MGKRMQPDNFRRVVEDIVILLVTAVWAISFLIDAISTKFTPSPLLNMVMMGVVGALFGKKILRGGDK